jgi:hypothetical protein
MDKHQGSHLHAAVEIGRAVGEVVNAKKMAKHFALDISVGVPTVNQIRLY